MWILSAFLILLLALDESHAQAVTPPGDHAEPYIIFSSHHQILRFNLDQTDQRVLQSNAGSTVALDFDYAQGFYYWSNQDDKRIYRAPLEGGDSELVVSNQDTSEVDGIAVDWVNNQLYWADKSFGTIHRLDLDGFTNEVVLIATGIKKPKAIVLDPHNDLMYFTDVDGGEPTIQRARMSTGSDQEVIISQGIEKPNGITLDYDTNRLFFADARTDRIESCAVDGSDRTVLFQGYFFHHPFSLSLYDDRIYWTELLLQPIVNAHKDTGSDISYIRSWSLFPYVIHVVHPSRQPLTDGNFCAANGGRGLCESLCTSYSNGYTCSCLDGFAINEDLHNCDDVNECGVNNGGCTHICNNMPGSFECQCLGGFALEEDGFTCTDHNECNNNAAGCEYACHNTDSGFYCSCPVGYQLQVDQLHCEDVNECVPVSPCPVEAQCVNHDGSYSCICPTGFVFDAVGGMCQDVDECMSGQSSCTQRCDNQPGGHSCSCHEGFLLEDDGITCTDINECEELLSNCQQTCVNIVGSFVCLCQEGYIPVGDGHNCEPIDCGLVDLIEGFTTQCTDSSYGSTCILSCVEGTLIGSSTMTCQTDGVWSITTAECISTTNTTEVNDPPHAIYPSSFMVPEDSLPGVTLGTLHTADADNHESYVYTLTSDPSDKFYIEASDNTLRTHGGLDYETTLTYTIMITTTDTGTPPLSGSFPITITVLDVNEPPTQPTLSSNTVSEHASIGDQVGTLFASDSDQDQEVTFSLVSSGEGRFQLQGDQLLVAGSLNYEVSQSYIVVVQAYDNGAPMQTSTAQLTIAVQNENDSPTNIYLSASEIAEVVLNGGSTSLGTVIGTLTTDDEDRGDSHTYYLQGASSGCFAIADSSLAVGDVSCFDHELNPALSVQITARDPHGAMIQQTFLVVVTDINEPPTLISLSSSSVKEHVAVGTVVGTLTVSDPDRSDSHQLTMKTGDSLFAVSGNVLAVITDLSFLDYPAGVTVSVEAVDLAGHGHTETFTINVQNVNERPNDISWEVFWDCSVEHETLNGLEIHACVPENTAENTLIAEVTATDPDLDPLMLVPIDNGDIFKLDQNGDLKVGGNGLNFESPLIGQVHSITLIAEDPAGLTSTAQFNIKILDVNDPPSNVLISNTMVGSNTAVGHSAAILQCIDEDTGDEHTFRLVNDADGKFITDGNQLKVNQDLTSLAGNQYTIEVQCSDGITELSTPVTFIISVFENGPIPDPTVIITISLSEDRIFEGQPGETVVGTLIAESTVPTGDFTFSIIGGASQLFSINQAAPGSSATLRTTEPLDFEESSIHYVVIKAEAQEGSGVQTFAVTVRDVNEPPKDVRLEHSSIHENQVGALVGIVSAVDPEGDSINFFILVNPGDAFEFQTGAAPNSRRLVSKRALDFETEPTLSISLYAQDPSSPSLTSDVYMTTVNVLNINEAPTQIQMSRLEIAENSPVGATVGTLMVSDPDSVLTDQGFTCVLQDSASGLFGLEGFSVKVSDSSRLDYESFAGSGEMPTINVECSDSGGLSVSQYFEITVANVAERPTNIVSATGLFEIAENNEEGATVAFLQTIDPDTDDYSAFQYIVSDSTTFSVNNQMLIADVQLNYERRNRYDIEITTTDEDGLTFSKDISVYVLNRNDRPTGIVMSQIMAVSAQLLTGTIIATLEAQDEDTSQQHEFEIQTQTPEGALQIASGNKLAIDEGSKEALSVEVTIVVRDLGVATPLFHVQTFTIAVDVVNLPPTGIELTGDTVVEGSAVGTVVGLVEVQDPSGDGEMFYCLLINDIGGPFDLVHQGGEIQLRVAYSERLNFDTDPTLSITIRCRDSLPENTVERTFVISVTAGPDRPANIIFINADNDASTTNLNPPDLSDLSGHAITGAIATIQEDAVTGFSVVAFMVAVDADGRLISDEAAPEIELITENHYNELQRVGRRRREVKRLHARSRRGATTDPDVIPTQFVVSSDWQYILVGDAPDYETQGEYMLYFKASDRNNPNLLITAQLRVVVLDIAEAPLDMTLSPVSVPENAAVDTVVGELFLNDPDGTSSAYVYNLISHGTPFYLQNRKILVQHSINHEVTPVITIQVMVSELNTDLQLTKNFNITVTDVPEPPTGLTVDGNTTVVIPETLEVGHYIGAFRVQDPDSSAGFTFSFYIEEDSNNFFSLSEGALLLGQRLDALTGNVLRLYIRVTDPTGLSFNQVITVRVTSDDQCETDGYCSPYATCLRGFCTCQPGFTGDGFTCTDIDECSQYPCNLYHSVSGGCQDGLGGIRNFTCVCKEGWTGQDCTVEVDSCESHLCNPMGFERCINTRDSDSYTCQCKRGFKGVLCDENINECVDHQCLNDGQCIDGIGLYTCKCSSPYEGYYCELDTSVCDSVKCPYNGTCLALPDRGHECRCGDGVLQDCSACDFGYGGDNCDPCKPPFTGPNCDIDTSVCDPNPCPTESVCKADVDKYFCLCPENLAIASCQSLVVAFSNKPTAQTEIYVPSWIPVVLVCLVLLAFTVLFIFAAIRRVRGIPSYKASSSFIPRRARFLSVSEQVMVYPEPDYQPDEQALQTFCPETRPREETQPQSAAPATLTAPTAALVARTTALAAPTATSVAPIAAPAAAQAVPTAASVALSAAAVAPQASAQEPTGEKPPPYSPPSNLFLASALGLIPPSYEEADVEAPPIKKKVNLDDDRAVAKFIETVAMPIGDRGTLMTKGSNLGDWEKGQLGLVDEVKPEQKSKRVRKKSSGRRPSVTRQLSVAAVAYQNPVFIPDKTMPGNRAAGTQWGVSSDDWHPPTEIHPNGSPGGNEKVKERRSPSTRPGVPERRRSKKTSISKSSSDVMKQNPVFKESDSEGSDDLFE